MMKIWSNNRSQISNVGSELAACPGLTGGAPGLAAPKVDQTNKPHCPAVERKVVELLSFQKNNEIFKGKITGDE